MSQFIGLFGYSVAEGQFDGLHYKWCGSCRKSLPGDQNPSELPRKQCLVTGKMISVCMPCKAYIESVRKGMKKETRIKTRKKKQEAKKAELENEKKKKVQLEKEQETEKEETYVACLLCDRKFCTQERLQRHHRRRHC